MKHFLLILTLTLVAAAKPPQPPQPNVTVPAAFVHQPQDAASPSVEWWKGFQDPLLDQLIARAVTGNLDLRTAASRVSEARAFRGTAKSALLPSVGSSTSANRLRGGFQQGIVRVPQGGDSPSGSFVAPFETGLVQGGLDARWEIDLFGSLRNDLRAADADALGAGFAAEDAVRLIRAEVARNYVELRGYDQQIGIVKRNLDAERELLDLIRARVEAGLSSELDVERQIAQVATVAAALPDFDQARVASAHRIAVLLGEPPASLISELVPSNRTLALPPAPAAVPSNLLKSRPDIRRAESAIAAAFARTRSARADLYPKLVITGLSGRQATEFSGLTLGGGNFFSVGPGVSLPIFSGGRIRSNIAVQDARLQQALRIYEQEILEAFEETENAFVARDRAVERHRILTGGVEASKRAVDLAQELYLKGLADYLTVLDAQRQTYQLEREQNAAETAVLRAAVALFKTIGQ
jgi:NodT family efflux transporter outer membrane factor (OMF) lipoprotein